MEHKKFEIWNRQITITGICHGPDLNHRLRGHQLSLHGSQKKIPLRQLPLSEHGPDLNILGNLLSEPGTDRHQPNWQFCPSGPRPLGPNWPKICPTCHQTLMGIIMGPPLSLFSFSHWYQWYASSLCAATHCLSHLAWVIQRACGLHAKPSMATMGVITVIKTEGGKTGCFYGYMLLLKALQTMPCPLPVSYLKGVHPKKPAMVLIFPTKGLQEEMVCHPF